MRHNKLEQKRKEIIKALKTSNFEKLISLNNKYIKDFPDDYFGWNINGIISEEREDFAESLNHYNKAEKLNNKQLNVKINISRIFLRLSNTDNAIKKLNEIILLDKKNIRAYDLLSKIYYIQKNYSKTIQVLSKAIEIDQNNIVFLERIGLSHFILRQFDKAKIYFENLIILRPDVFNHHFNLGNINYNLGKMAEAIKSYSEALKIESKSIALIALNESFRDSNLRYQDFTAEIDLFNSSIKDTIVIKN